MVMSSAPIGMSKASSMKEQHVPCDRRSDPAEPLLAVLDPPRLGYCVHFASSVVCSNQL